MSYFGNQVPPSANVNEKRYTYTATAGQTTFAVPGGYTVPFCDVFVNGIKMVNGSDVNVSSGTNVVLATGLEAGDVVDIVAEEASRAAIAPASSIMYSPAAGGDTVSVAQALDGVADVNVADYTALRAYTGTKTRVYVTGTVGGARPSGIAGVFQYDATDTTSADNGGTIIVGVGGKRWKRDFSGAVSVTWFGAVTGGSNNSADSIKRAIEFGATSGKVVCVDDGVYSSTNIALSNLSFRIEFKAGAKIVAMSTIPAVFSLSNCNAEFDSPKIEGAGLAGRGISSGGSGSLVVNGGDLGNFYDNTTFCAAVYASSLSIVRVEGARVYDCNGGPPAGVIGDSAGAARGLYAISCTDVIFTNNVVTNIIGEEGDSIHVASDCTSSLVAGNTVRGFTRRGIKIQSRGVTVMGNKIFETAVNANANQAAGINVIGVDDCIISGNIVSAINSPYGIFSSGANTIVSGNTVYSDVNTSASWPVALDQRAIVVTGKNSSITGNITEGGLRGIDATADECVVVGNTCRNAAMYGILMGASSGSYAGSVCSGNIIAASIAGRMPTYGLVLWNLTDGLCQGNVLRGFPGETNNFVLSTGTSARNVIINNVGNSANQMVVATQTDIAYGNINPAVASRSYATPDKPIPLGAVGLTLQTATGVGTISRAFPVYEVNGTLRGYVPVYSTVS